MCYKLCLITLSVLICALHSAHGAAVDQSQLVVEKQPDGQNATASVDAASVPEECHQPKETGRCFALFYRYAYNVESHACEEFVYGGCAGNSNNFETKERCEHICLGKPIEDSATELSLQLTTDQAEVAEATTSSSQSASD